MKLSKIITIIISVIVFISLCVAVVFAVKPIDNENADIMYNVSESNRNVLSVGKVLYLDEKQSMNPSIVQSVEFLNNKIVLYNDKTPEFNGIVTNTEQIRGNDFYNYCNNFGLTDISPIYLPESYNIKIESLAEKNSGSECKYKLFYIDKEPILLGFVYQNENGEDIVWCISDIENDAFYKQTVISKEQATQIAFEKHKELYPDLDSSPEEILFKDKKEEHLGFNTLYNSNDSGHPYYVVTYFDNDSIADHYYYCIDAINGEIIFNSLMGD